MKRLFDLMITVIALCFLWPFVIILILVVKVKLGSPVLFKQQRPGLHGKPFDIYKFRSMTNEKGRDGKLLPDEQRLVSFGRFLRRYSLDEIPQLYNVLKSDISLVGPRALLMEYLPLYSDEESKRHTVKPGITGWAQVNGRNAIEWEKKFEYDLWYVENQSFLLDLKILWLTIMKVIHSEDVVQEGHATVEKFRRNNE